MSTVPGGTVSGGARRARNTLAAAVLMLAVTAIAGLAVFLGTRVSARFDVTATREHALSPQTVAVLARLNHPVTLVIATDLRTVSGPARTRLTDVLDKFTRATPHLRIVTIDTASAAGVAEFDGLLDQIAQSDAPIIDAAAKAVAAGSAVAEDLANGLDALSAALLTTGGAAGERAKAVWENLAAVARVDAGDLRAAAREAARLAAGKAEGLPVPPLDQACRLLRSTFERTATNLASLAGTLDAVRNSPQTSAELKAAATNAAQSVPTLRDRAARTGVALDRAGRIPVLAVARTVQRSRAVLLVDSAPAPIDDPRPRVTAIDADALLPSPAAGEAALDQRARAEELVASAIGVMLSPVRPVVVLVHPLPQKLAPDFAELTEFASRLSLRGIELVEWATALDREPPIIPPTASGARRPVVYVSLSLEVRAPEDAARLGRLGDALAQLVASGRNVLISVNPSTLPGVGAPDPCVSFLEPLGLRVDSGRPLMEEVRSAGARAVSPDQYTTDPGAGHPIARTIAGLRTLLLWPLAMSAAPTPGVRIEPVITLPDRPGLWAESEWQPYRQVPAGQRAQVTNPPAKDSSRDGAGDGSPWTVAAAIERTSAEFPGTQRLLVVGSNGWFVDGVLRLSAVVDGKPFAITPGNNELLLASVAWLAGQDELLARSASAMSAPTIPNLSSGQIAALRWLLIAGVPGAVLVLGVLYRAVRG
ncbi:MAG: hypothetical protein KIT68_03280 [Phycisphaeraceae bacterium]|nr:hypothetical protein [Phycisphaeraceae bacterium]